MLEKSNVKIMIMGKKKRESNSKLLSVKTACEYYGLEPSLLYHWIRQRKFPIYKLDKKVLFEKSDFEFFLQYNRIPAGDEIEKQL